MPSSAGSPPIRTVLGQRTCRPAAMPSSLSPAVGDTPIGTAPVSPTASAGPCMSTGRAVIRAVTARIGTDRSIQMMKWPCG